MLRYGNHKGNGLETMSIKALAAKVLERNKQRNRLETQSFLANKKQQNIQPIRKPQIEIQTQQAKIVNGELICLSPVDDLAPVIIDLTKDDFPEQKRLLRLHCQKYDDKTHFWNLALRWEVKTCLFESKGYPLEGAELLAAEKLGLLAFMDELKVQ